MLKSKAIDIIKTFSGPEFSRFRKFVESPYFNTNSSIIRLVNELENFHPEYDSEDLTEESLYKRVYHNNKFSYSLMRNLMSELLFLSESFLLNNRLNKDILKNPANIIELLDELQSRDISNHFRLRLKNAEKIISKEKFDSAHYRNNVQLINIILDDEYNKVTFKNNLKDIFFRKAIFELCYMANTLYRNANSIHFISIDNNVKADDSYFFIFLKCIDINRFLKEMNRLRTSESLIIEIYFKLVLLILDPANLKNYYEVRNLIIRNINKFSNKEKYSLLNVLRNYVLFQSAAGEERLKAEQRLINLEMLDSIDFKKDKMESILGIIFIGIFFEAVSGNDLIYAEKFINKYSGQLRKEIRKDIYGYAYAFILFAKKDYEGSLEKLSYVKPPNKVYFIHIKHLYMRLYYELGYYDEGLSVIDTYRHYLDGNKILNLDKKKYFLKICKLYLRLYRLKMNTGKYNDYDVIKFMKELDADSANQDIKWILSKLEEINNFLK
ncbi:MAG TPA: hypothetical protein PKC91_09765 [Ignavibacteria bacterium]|nr:hypothetical protein [Ignavibacteria bacterium]